MKLDKFTRAYLEAALWSSTDADGEPLDRNYTVQDIASESLEQAVKDCDAFQAQNADDIEGHTALAGHDFWLTRNRHGAGFWDGDWPDEGKRLTDAAHAYGECVVYVGDDGRVYIHR